MTELPRVLDNLTEDEAYLYAILSDPSGLDQAEFLWTDQSSEDNLVTVDGEKIAKHPSPSGCFRAWAFQVPWWRDQSALQIDQCVAGGQLVLVRDGWKAIEDVEVGDLVLTHRQRWRRVTKTWARGKADVVRVVGQGHTGLFVTGDHLLWARPSRYGMLARDGHRRKILEESTWMSPSRWEWSKGYHQTRTANWTVTSTLLPDAPMPPKIEHNRWCDVDWSDPTFLWLFGHFIAQGSTYVPKSKTKSAVHRAYWHCRSTRAHWVLDRLRQLGMNPSKRIDRNVTHVAVALKPVVLWLREEAGHLAYNKTLPNWVMTLGADQRQEIFDGMCSGDGYWPTTERCVYVTVSWRLALSFKALAASLGYSVSMNLVAEAGERVICGRRCKTRDAWAVHCQRLKGQRSPGCTFDEGVLWAQVTKIEPAGRAEVYDLEVEEDNSFIVEGVVVHNCARSVGKSLSTQVRACSFPFRHPGQEMVITAPELVHLEPLSSLIENRYLSTRTLREMVPTNRSAITHRPFQLNLTNGCRIIGRIPQRDGRGVKGVHPIALELDEAQDYPHAGWIELQETLKRGWEGAQWRAHGVTRGVRDDFYNFTQDSPDNPWRVHKFAAMWRPNWTDKEREEAIAKYGSREDPDYRRNVLGLHGDKTNPIFVVTSLMKNVDVDKVSRYNTEEYFKVSAKSEQLELYEQQMTDVLLFPQSHLSYVGNDSGRPLVRYWAGMDIGFTIDPSEILICVEHRKKPDDEHSILKLLTRISMVRMPHREQMLAILHTIDFYRPQVFAMDKGGVGLSLFQELTEHIEAFRQKDFDRLPAWMQGYDLEAAVTTIKGYHFGEKVLVDLDPSVEIGPYDDTAAIVAKSGLKRNAKEFSTDTLRDLVDNRRLLLPWDDDLLKQFQGGTWTSARSMDAYGKRTFSTGNDHCLDAARMLVLGWSLNKIDEITKEVPAEPVYDAFISL